ncbi:MAG TPA: radical SAM protein, partial [Pyrinomonadaceae bacterium]|nr:radical SAM protein [Pyrinomonadaceae bacterium]
MKRAGIYIHIPFCRSRCSYCDFATGAYEGQLAERYVSALSKEIATFNLAPPVAAGSPDASTGDVDARVASVFEVDTIYFGGGTPSLLTPAQVRRILRAVGERFRVALDAEVTLEMNP